MIGYPSSTLFLFTKMKSLRAQLSANSIMELQTLKHCLDYRDILAGMAWLQQRVTPIIFINLHFFTPQQAIAWLDRSLENNIVQLGEQVSLKESVEIVDHLKNEPYEFFVYIPAELILPPLEVKTEYRNVNRG